MDAPPTVLLKSAARQSSDTRSTRRAFLRALAVSWAAAGVGLAACGGGSRTIEMRGSSRFEPGQLSITAGELVTWRNTSTIDHTATGDPTLARDTNNVRLAPGAAPWDSGTIAPGTSWSRRFDIRGEYRYFCQPHELAGMIGTIVVN